MNTPTHLVVNWSLARASGQDYPLSAVLLGSVAPDIPLYLLSIGGGAYYTWVKGMPASDAANKIWGELYFNDPWWISLHNLLHSPLMLAALLGTLWLAARAGRLPRQLVDLVPVVVPRAHAGRHPGAPQRRPAAVVAAQLVAAVQLARELLAPGLLRRAVHGLRGLPAGVADLASDLAAGFELVMGPIVKPQ